MIVRDDKKDGTKGGDAFAREEASQKKLRESIDLNKQMIARSDALLKGRVLAEPPNPVSS
jgi:hypothetical protein